MVAIPIVARASLGVGAAPLPTVPLVETAAAADCGCGRYRGLRPPPVCQAAAAARTPAACSRPRAPYARTRQISLLCARASMVAAHFVAVPPAAASEPCCSELADSNPNANAAPCSAGAAEPASLKPKEKLILLALQQEDCCQRPTRCRMRRVRQPRAKPTRQGCPARRSQAQLP